VKYLPHYFIFLCVLLNLGCSDSDKGTINSPPFEPYLERVFEGEPGVKYGSPAFSYDGQFLFFDKTDFGLNPQYEIFAMEYSTGLRFPVFEQPGKYQAPAPSPTSALLAFRDDVELYVQEVGEADETREKIFGWAQPPFSWSPNGHWILCLVHHDNASSVTSIPVTGGELAVLVDPNEGEQLAFPSWSPAGDQICYLSYLAGEYRMAIKANTSNTPVFLDTGGLGLGDMKWSPVNNEIAFFGYELDENFYNGIYLYDLDGNTYQRIIPWGPDDGNLDGLNWSPDGKKLVFSMWDSSGGDIYELIVRP